MLSLLAAAILAPPTNLRLASLFTDHMVLQQGMRVPIFGAANPGQPVTVELAGQRVRTSADANGRWLARLNPIPAGGPYTLAVRAETMLQVTDVLVGEVWLASGQSNMEWRVAWTDTAAKDAQDADPAIRFFTVGRASSETPADTVKGTWQPVDRRSVFQLSAVAFGFARELRRTLRVPVGIIHSSWGGTPAESWTDRDTLLSEPGTASAVKAYLAGLPSFAERRLAYVRDLDRYNAAVYKQDPGNQGYHLGWADFDNPQEGWEKTIVPGAWETHGLDMDGSAWYRRDVEVPDAWYGRELKLELGTVDDLDTTYFNGNRIGFTTEKTKDSNKLKRVYRVAPGLVRKGRNVIAVRVFDRFGDGGLTGEASDMRLGLIDGSDSVPLDGEWLFRIENRMEPATAAVVNAMPVSPPGPGHPQAPGGLWNGMVAPLAPYAIRGVIWYQGESNAPRAAQYRTLFPIMIRAWRRKWGQGDFPFYYVQLAGFRARKDDCSESDWAELREAQALALKLPRTGMAVAIDQGSATDIHPRDKTVVSQRLARLALTKDYGQPGLSSGPVFQSVRFEGREAQVFFGAVGQRLTTLDGQKLSGFALAGADRRFYWADARISGSSVVVSSPKVAKPVAVRYGWADNPGCNLANSAGLPASPFRTDDWPGITK